MMRRLAPSGTVVASFRYQSGAIRLLMACCAAIVAIALAADPARAAFGLSDFDGGTFAAPPPGTTDPLVSGPAYTQAGGHPYEAWTAFQMNRVVAPDGAIDAGTFRPDGGNFRNVHVDLPPGLIGNPTAVPECPKSRRIAVSGDLEDAGGDPKKVEELARQVCPPGSAVGLALVSIAGDPGVIETVPAIVFNLQPPPGVAAQFGFNLMSAQAFLDARVRADGEYAISIDARNANQAARLLGVRVALWGNPADPIHDSQRCIALTQIAIEITPPDCSLFGTNPPGTPLGPNPFPADHPRKAFLTLPTACPRDGVGLETRIRVEGWEADSGVSEASFISHLPPAYPAPRSEWGAPQGPTACERLPFNPSFGAQPDTSQADAPTGLTVNLGFPLEGLEDPNGLAPAQLRDARVTLPEGMTFNPAAAGGLEACSDAQAGFRSVTPVECAEASKIASVRATTPLLEEELTGAVYVGTQLSDDPESGDMFRIVLALQNPERGVFVKLLGKVRANKDTGRLEATFQNNPQIPVRDLSLHFKSGPRAPLASPPTCGEKRVDAQLSSWAGQLVERTDSFVIECTPELGGFKPAFSAGTISPTGGAFSPFAVRIDRNDGDQYLQGVGVEMPTGVIAKLKGVPLCGDADASAGTCPIESRVGTATVGAGPGSNPFFLDGSVSLTGPYKGAPYGLSVAVRAVAGPFDLGMVVVRQAIFIDPIDAHLTVKSDPLPIIVKGVPLRLRSVNVDVNRPGFTLNPTSCAPKKITATLAGSQGAVSTVVQRFQATDCRALAFKPKLALRLTGRKQVGFGKHPGLRAVLRQGGRQANIRKVAVKLPLTLALDPDNARALCEFEDGLRVDCPKASIIGRARAFTPVLNRPLSGPVYFVKGVRIDRRTGRRIRTLPTLLIPLRGEVAIDLRARSSVSRNQLVNTFSTVPDAPVSRFELSLDGGKNGILVVTRGRHVCRGKQVAGVQTDAQNGKRRDFASRMRTPCSSGRGGSARR